MKKKRAVKHLILGIFMILFFSQPNSSLFTHNDSSTLAIAEIEETENLDTIGEQPVTPFSSTPWNHIIMNIDRAWEDGYTGDGVTIAILDTGFDIRHPDLTMAGGNSVFSDDPWSNDHSGHGTHIAGIIGARAGSTYQGIAPDATLYGIKIYHEDDVDESGYVSTDVNSVINGIQLAMDFNPDIIVISSGLTYNDEELHQKIIEAHSAGILIIAASGNGNSSVNYPASYPEVVAITAIDERMHPALDIIYGQENDFAAPGVNIGGLSIPESTYSYPYILMSGSSQAVPHAAGLAAILMQKYNMRGSQIHQIMNDTALDIGDPGFYGHGLLRYVSDDRIVQTVEEPEEEPMDQDVVPAESTATDEEVPELEDEEDEQTAQKPISSRAPDQEEDISPETLAFYSVKAIEQGEHGSLPPETILLVETGGILEVEISLFDSFFLSEDQVKQIRDRNISIRLTRPEASWQIPPANLLPGSAILHFYEGTLDSLEEHEAQVSLPFTTSIYQEDTNRLAYPSQMALKISMNHRHENELSEFESYGWDKEEEEWYEPEMEITSEEDALSMTILTRQTTTFGIFDPEHMPEIEEPEIENTIVDDENKGLSLYYPFIFGMIIFVVLLFIIRLLIKKRK